MNLQASKHKNPRPYTLTFKNEVDFISQRILKNWKAPPLEVFAAYSRRLTLKSLRQGVHGHSGAVPTKKTKRTRTRKAGCVLCLRRPKGSPRQAGMPKLSSLSAGKTKRGTLKRVLTGPTTRETARSHGH